MNFSDDTTAEQYKHPLPYAVKFQNLELVKELLRLGARAHDRAPKLIKTAAQLAADGSDIESTTWVLSICVH